MIGGIILAVLFFVVIGVIVGEPPGTHMMNKRRQRKSLQSQGPCTCYDPITKQWDAARNKACETHGTKN